MANDLDSDSLRFPATYIKLKDEFKGINNSNAIDPQAAITKIAAIMHNINNLLEQLPKVMAVNNLSGAVEEQIRTAFEALLSELVSAKNDFETAHNNLPEGEIGIYNLQQAIEKMQQTLHAKKLVFTEIYRPKIDSGAEKLRKTKNTVDKDLYTLLSDTLK